MLHLIFGFLLYFLPSIIGRDKRDAAGIFLLNLLLGWIFVTIGSVLRRRSWRLGEQFLRLD